MTQPTGYQWEVSAVRERFGVPLRGARPASSHALRVRLFKNSALIMACRVAAMLASILTVPFVIGKLGLLGYGSWEVLLAVSVVTAIFQNAWGGTLLWRVSSAYGAGDQTEIRRLPRLGIAVTLMGFAVTFPIVFACRHSLVQMFQIPAELRQTAEVILPVVVGVSILGGINEALAAVLRGSQQAGFASVVQTAAGFINAGVVLTGLAMGAGLWGLLAGFVVATVLTGVGYYFRVSKLYGWFDIRPKLPTREDVLAMRRYMGFLSLGSISAVLRGDTDKLILASFASPAWVGVYAIAARMASVVMESSNFFYVPTIAAAGALNGRGDWAGVRSLYATMTAVFPAAAGVVSVLVLSLYDRLVVFWLGRSVPGIAPILFLVVAGNAVAVMLTGSGTSICKGLGKLELEATYVVTSLILNAILTISLVLACGAIGTVIASTVSWAAGATLFVVLLHRKFDLPVVGTYRSAAALLYVAVVVAGARLLIPGYAAKPDRLPALISALGFGAVVGCVYLLPFALASAREFLSRAPMLVAGGGASHEQG